MDTELLSKYALENKVAVITGSGDGIGKSIALYFARAGAHIVAAEIEPAAAQVTSGEVQALGRECLPVVADVQDSGQVAGLVATALARFGRIDILVNNVGGTSSWVPIIDTSEEQWDDAIRLNLKTTFLCNSAVGAVMARQQSGNIINMASGAGERACPGKASYGAAKAAIISFTKTLSVELAPYHIRVNVIAPGPIWTPRVARVSGTPQEVTERMGVHLGRVGQPDDIAMAALYLASDASDYITGSVIDVQGGPLSLKGDVEKFKSLFVTK